MNIYNCAILLMMCGMAHSAATQVRGGCLFGSEILSIGAHTHYPCMRMICDMDGQVTFYSCPRMECNPGMVPIEYLPEDNDKPYPDCCPHPLCKPIRQDEPYALPLIQYK